MKDNNITSFSNNFKPETELKENNNHENANKKLPPNIIQMNRKKSSLTTMPELLSLEKNEKNKKKKIKKGIDKTFWVPDSNVKKCNKCGIEFYFFERKHHCRVCGKIFCKKCIFSFYERTHFDDEGELKCCSYCKDMCVELNSILNQNLVEFKDDKGNKNFETKLYDYINKEKSPEKKTLQDEQINKSYKSLVNETIENILKTSEKYPNLYQKWTKILTKLLIKIFNNICPSSQYLKDSIDIRKYIKIKTIEYQDQSLCEAIDGYVMRKKVCTETMKTEIENPTILLINRVIEEKNDSISNNKDDFNIMNNRYINDEYFNSYSISDKSYFNILNKKIQKLNPQIILIGEKLSTELQNLIFQQNSKQSIIVGIKIKTLKDIARCTTSFVVPSIDLINKGIILGKCSKFIIKKIKRYSSNNLLSNNEFNLIQFSGCGGKLFYTLLLSGENKEELKEIKKLLKDHLLRTIRDFYIQMKMFKDFNYYYPIKQNNNNIIYKDKNFLNFKEGFNTQLVNHQNNSFELIQITMCKGKNPIQNINNSFIKKSFRIQSLDETLKLKETQISNQENEILESVYYICESSFVCMKYYSPIEGEEKTLGQLIFDLCSQKKTKCVQCTKTIDQHIFCLYKGNQRLVLTIMDNETLKINFTNKIKESIDKCIENIDNRFNDIYTFGFCNICRNITSPFQKLNDNVSNFSASKFYYHFFYNHSVRNLPFAFYDVKDLGNLIDDCNEFAFKDISRYFITPNGTVSFNLEEIVKYIPIEIQLNKNIELLRNKNKNELDNLIFEINDLSDFFFPEIEKSCNSILDFINSLNSEKYNNEIIKLKNIVSSTLTFYIEIKELKKEIIKENFFDILDANVYVKYYYCKIFQEIYLIHCILKAFKNLFFVIFFDEEEEKIEKMEKENENGKSENNEEIKEKENEEKKKDENNNEEKEKNEMESKKINENNGTNTFSKKNYKKMIEKDFENKGSKFKTFVQDFLKINDNSKYKKLISKILFFDSNHKKYSINVNENDIFSLISYALTSDEYLNFSFKNCKYKVDNLERIEIPFTEQKINQNDDNEININNKNIDKNAQKNKKDSSLFNFSLLFNLNHIEFKLENFEREKLLTQMKNQLLNEKILHFKYNMKSDIKQFLFESITEPLNKKDDILHPELLEKLINFNNLTEYKQKFNELKSITKTLISKKKKYEEKEKLKFGKLIFEESQILDDEFIIKIYHPIQFQALRELYCSTYKEFILSMRKTYTWENVSGGKSNASFYKTYDERFIIKCISKFEFKMFIQNTYQYFTHNYKYLFLKMPSAMAKILGAFKITKKLSNKNIEKKYCVVMENLLYNLEKNKYQLQIYDLKGSKLNRYSKNKNKVLLDTNFKEDFEGEPLVLDIDVYNLFRSAILNDSLLLCKIRVIDYSLLVILINEKEYETEKKIKFGILDYFRKYTWDKKIETKFKKLMNYFQDPTIISPENYKKRFDEIISSYFIGSG